MGRQPPLATPRHISNKSQDYGSLRNIIEILLLSNNAPTSLLSAPLNHFLSPLVIFKKKFDMSAFFASINKMLLPVTHNYDSLRNIIKILLLSNNAPTSLLAAPLNHFLSPLMIFKKKFDMSAFFA